MSKMLIILYAIYMGTMAAYDSDGERHVGMIVLCSIFSAAFNCSFQGLLDMQDKLHNPFLDGQVCVPHEIVVKGLQALGNGLKRQAEEFQLSYDGSWGSSSGLTNTEPQRPSTETENST